MQVASKNDTQSILSIARQSALGKSSKDKNSSEAEGNFQAPSSSSGVSYSQGYSAFQSSLAKTSVDGATASGADALVANGGGLMSNAMTQSDWDLIKKTTGLTPANDKTGGWYDAEGNKVHSGSAVDKAGAMVFAMSDMRISSAQFGSAGDMFSGRGDITTEQLQQYLQKYQSAAANGAGPFSSVVLQDLEKALGS